MKIAAFDRTLQQRTKDRISSEEFPRKMLSLCPALPQADGRFHGMFSCAKGTKGGRRQTGQATSLCIGFLEPVQGPVAVGCGARRDGGFVGDEELNMFDREESLIT